MQRFKKVIALVLTVFMLVTLLPSIAANAADADMRYGRKKLGEMTNGAALQFAYDKLVSGCAANTPTSIDMSQCAVSVKEFTDYVFPMFYGDYPEYFWVSNGGYSYTHTADSAKKLLSVTPGYHSGIGNLASAKSAFNSKVEQLTASLSGSDYDKAKTLHDRLIQTVTYTSAQNDQNAYGALVEGKAVCNGYARAYQHLMLKAGIPAWYVRGNSINPTTNNREDHAWNLVKLDGQWYYTDVTWDDQGSNTFYAYFNVTTQQILTDHTLDAGYAALVPQATATAANYYLKENRSFTGYDRAKLVNLLKKDQKKSQFYITGDQNAFLSALNSDLLNIGKDLGGTGAFQISYSVVSLGNAMILEVVVVGEGHTHAAKTNVPQVNATCLANGTKAYVICDCGFKFLDSACTQQITVESELTIPAVAHSPSGWKNDATIHWKECTACGSETTGTRGNHSDSNTDHKCDTCGYALPVADENGNVNADSGSKDPDTQVPEKDPQNAESTPTDGATVPDASAPDSATTAPSSHGATAPDTQQNDGDKKKSPVVLVVLGGTVIIAAGAVGFYLWKKKTVPVETESSETEE